MKGTADEKKGVLTNVCWEVTVKSNFDNREKDIVVVGSEFSPTWACYLFGQGEYGIRRGRGSPRAGDGYVQK